MLEAYLGNKTDAQEHCKNAWFWLLRGPVPRVAQGPTQYTDEPEVSKLRQESDDFLV